MADLQQANRREIEDLQDNICQLGRELQLQKLIIDSFIPQEYRVCVWVSRFAADDDNNKTKQKKKQFAVCRMFPV